MENTSAIEIRRRASALGDQKTMDLMFAFLLGRVTRVEGSGLEIVLESEEPHGYNPSKNIYDRVYIVDVKSQQRMGTKLSRLRWEYGINCVKIAVKIEPARRGGGPARPHVSASEEQLRALRRDAQSLIGNVEVPSVFNDDAKETRVTKKPVTRVPTFGVPVMA